MDKKFSDIDHDAWRLWEGDSIGFNSFEVNQNFGKDVISFPMPSPLEDLVNHPYHYTQGKVEAIDVIEDAIKEAPGAKAGFLQAQVLKYMLRLWHKIDAKEDAEKARWYLNRLINSL